ncbi:nucleotidyl transferase AbiEii/AbiGii toxin family protein [Maribacter aurantiacus]|uniref:Nucleotidyl transferase AbiEii/AbiGii toxin family protein n=1 Tax=Maribacter aurantiacus TaxID=1882343 RepID=A0A5R8M6L8_9FLAO|nr:nucleotidyl transferase AbiEii/AbiGii toxin family protein [Maribacter aurantiacus]TLF45203.1 nucleotidyl transferase AbiEii/AbiGii toxin family protein [Maribacter aurantiacus]
MANYKSQVSLLLNILPDVAKETCFALHGGTAINLFVREMPRLSVDIDLTYVPVENRETSFKNITGALERIKATIQAVVPNAKVIHKQAELKLQISNTQAQIKLEINQAMRGTIAPPIKMTLCEKAQEAFDAFCEIQVVPIGQLYGGKICAALDRQHPRDFFDVKYLLENEGFTEEVRTGFLFGLLSSNRPLHEMLTPNLLDQRSAMANQFEGMSEEEFTYEDFEARRSLLIKTIHENLTDTDKKFLLSFQNGTPDWSLLDFGDYPAVQWKLQNLQKLKEANPEKHREQLDLLESGLIA